MNRELAYLKVSELKTYPGIYHSSQTPGWVSWISIVQLHDGSILVGLNEVTGCRCPVQPEPLPERMAATFGSDFYNFRGPNRVFRIIRCRDAEDTFLALWQDHHVEALEDSLWQPACYLQVQTSDGTLLRSTQGRRLPEGYACGAIGRSEDGGKTWSEFRPVRDRQAQIFICRTIQLRDGRLLMSAYDRDNGNLLLVSRDDGKSWSEPIPAMQNDATTWRNESAIVELPNGDILMMARVHDKTGAQYLDATRQGKNPRENRQQMRLVRKGASWVPGPVRQLDIPHSGHPEIIATREGVLLYSSTEGFWGSTDEGESWTKIETLPISTYYPHSAQLADGRIVVVGHNGGDAPYPPRADMMAWKVSFRIEQTF